MAQRVIRYNTDKPYYMMSAYDYILNPLVIADAIYFNTGEKDLKVVPEGLIDFIVDYNDYK